MKPLCKCDWCERPHSSFGICPTYGFFKTYRQMYKFADRHHNFLDIDHNVLIYDKVKEVIENKHKKCKKRKKTSKDFILAISELETV